MCTVLKAKSVMKSDNELRKMLLRGDIYEIILDLDGDSSADIGLYDSNKDGEIDTVAADVFKTGDFNLYTINEQMANIAQK